MALSLALERTETGWTRARLELGNESIDLGAEAWSWLCPRLEALADGHLAPVAGMIAGSSASHVATFAERHWSIYAARREGELVLLFQSPDTQRVFRTDVEDATLLLWRELLRRGV